MKNLFKFLSLSILVSFIALGCSNTSGDAVSLTPASKSTMKTITLVATGDKDAIVFPVDNSLVSASIVAGTVDAENDLDFYLFTKNEATNATEWKPSPNNPLKFKANSGTSNVGTVPLNIDDGYYKFELFAVDKSVTLEGTTEAQIRTKAMFLGQTQADLRTSTDTVSFYLTPDGLTGKAAVSIGLKTIGWTCDLTKYDVEAKLTYKTGEGLVTGTSAQNIDTLTTLDPGTNQFNETSVNPGTYNFEVSFTSAASKTYTWSDTIIVASNHNINTVVAIPEVVEIVPEPPSDFNATFKDPDTTTAGYYNVEFAWKADDSVNENYFAIDLLEIDSSIASANITATNTEWDDTYLGTLGKSKSDIVRYGKDFYGNPTKNWVDGSLYRNCYSATMSLPLGKRYIARISAVNDAGDSDYCYINFANSNVPGAALTPGYSKFAASSKVINRYRLTYNLLGGTITIPGTPTTTSKENIVEYRTQNEVANSAAGKWNTSATPATVTDGTYVGGKITSNVDVPSADIWNPACDKTTYTSLIKSGKEWTAWRLESSSSGTKYDATPATDPYDPPDYKGCENLTLFASYVQTTAPVTIYDDNEYNIGIKNISLNETPDTGVLAADGSAFTAAKLQSDSAIKFNTKPTGAQYINWNVTYADDQPNYVKWEKVEYSIAKTDDISNPIAAGSSSTTTSPFKLKTDFKLPFGKYAITFYAYVKNKTQPYTYTVYVDVIEK